MGKPRILVLSLGGTITMVPGEGGGIAPKLGAADLVASVPGLDAIAGIEADSPFRLPSPSLKPDDLVDVARRVSDAFAKEELAGAVVIQGTDTIEESAFILDLLVEGERPVVVTGAMRGAAAPGAEGPANVLAAVQVAAAPEAGGLGTLVVLNDEIHAARFVQKSHTALPSAFASPAAGPIGVVAEGRPRFWTRVPRLPVLPKVGGPLPVVLLRWAMGEDGRLLTRLSDLGYAGAVIEGMGAGHVPADAAPLLGELAQQMPVVLASRCAAGPVFTGTYGYAGAEIDLIGRGLVPAGYLSGVKARLLLGLSLRSAAGGDDALAPFASYQ